MRLGRLQAPGWPDETMGEDGNRLKGEVPMNVTFIRAVACIAVLCSCSHIAWSQPATTNRNAIDRRDPTTQSPGLEHLLKGERLTVLDAKQDSGFYHVRSENDVVGWVWSKFVSILAPTPPSTPPVQPPDVPQCDTSLESHVYHPGLGGAYRRTCQHRAATVNQIPGGYR
jgi:hypothetical protein